MRPTRYEPPQRSLTLPNLKVEPSASGPYDLRSKSELAVPFFDTSILRVRETWTRYVHPDGSPFFRNSRCRVVTDTWIHDPVKLNELVEEVNVSVAFFHTSSYFCKWSRDRLDALEICHEHGGCFFIDRVAWTTMSHGDDPLSWDFHATTLRRVNFWGVLSRYPVPSYLPSAAEEEFVAALAHGFADTTVHNDYPICEYPKSKCEALMKTYSFLKDSPAKSSGTMTWLISRTLYDIYDRRLKLGWATPNAIVNGKQEDRPKSVKTVVVERVLSVLLLGAHANYPDRVRKVEIGRAGDHVYAEHMQQLMVQLLEEWRETRLLGAILCCAYILFLLLPNATPIIRSAVAVSIVLVLISIMMNLFHTFRHKEKLDGTFDDAHWFSHQTDSILKSDHLLSVFLALPIAMLYWSIVLFAITVILTALVPV